jgi:hypothetical protein
MKPNVWQGKRSSKPESVAEVIAINPIVIIWIVALTAGCLVMIPVGIWTLSKRLARN